MKQANDKRMWLLQTLRTLILSHRGYRDLQSYQMVEIDGGPLLENPKEGGKV
jgi:hypothetical protein